MKHNEIMRASFVSDRRGETLAVQFDNPSLGLLLFRDEDVMPEALNLLRASPLLYQQVQRNQEAIDELIRVLEEAGADRVAAPLSDLVAANRLVLSVALNGAHSIVPGK